MWPASAAVIAPVVWLAVLLQEAPSSDAVLLQYGAVGVVAVLALLAVRVLFKRETDAHDYDRQRADRLEAEMRHMHETYQERVIPALQESSRALQEAIAVLREQRR